MTIDTNDVQVFGAGSASIGSWLQISISVATLIFILIKIWQLLANKNKGLF